MLLYTFTYSDIVESTSQSHWPRGAVVRTAAQRSNDPYVAVRIQLLDFRMRPNKPRSRAVHSVARKRTIMLKSMGVKHRSRFEALSPIMVTVVR
jgi:hypothetical protein